MFQRMLMCFALIHFRFHLLFVLLHGMFSRYGLDPKTCSEGGKGFGIAFPGTSLVQGEAWLCVRASHLRVCMALMLFHLCMYML